MVLIFLAPVHLQAQINDSALYYFRNYEYQKLLNLPDDPPVSSELLLLKARSLYQLQRFEDAIPLFLEYRQKDSTDLQSITTLAACYESLGNSTKALEFYKRAGEISPGNDYFLKQQAGILFSDENYAAAKSIYLKVGLNDSSSYNLKQLARCFEQLGIKDSAIWFYRKSLEVSPADYNTVLRLAAMYKDLEKYESALALTDTFLLGDPSKMKIIRMSGWLHFLTGNYEMAARRFENCFELGDSSEFVNKYLGYSLYRMKEFDSARSCLIKAFATDSLNASLAYALGVSCYSSFYKKQGIEYLEKALKIVEPSPSFVSMVYQDLAMALASTYRHEEAFDAWFKAYRQTPGDTLLLFRIASHCDNKLKDKSLAISWYEKFLETRGGGKVSFPRQVVPGMLVVSWYDYAERRILELKEELFWEGTGED